MGKFTLNNHQTTNTKQYVEKFSLHYFIDNYAPTIVVN